MMDLSNPFSTTVDDGPATRVNNPQAMVIVWNYEGRMGTKSMGPLADGSNSVQDDDVLILASEIKSIQTSKTKSNPCGNFQIDLAPTQNWISQLTVGSWLAIFMTQDIVIPKDFGQSGNNTVKSVPKRQLLKMIGRIDSVRAEITVNNAGARNTSYTVVGRDWGCVFENIIYIDGLSLLENAGAGLADIIEPLKALRDIGGDIKKAFTIPSTTTLITSLKNFFGEGKAQADAETAKLLGVHVYPSQIMVVPPQLRDFFDFEDDANWDKSAAISRIIKVVDGKLVGEDKFSKLKAVVESVGLLQVNSLIGGHSLWELLVEHSNPVLNELYAEIRWGDDPTGEKPKLALYKRLKPFVLSKQNFGSFAYHQSKSKGTAEANRLASPFVLLKQNVIPMKDVITINAGNNWRDTINFIEILWEDPDLIAMAGFASNQLKRTSQILNTKSVARDGLRPMLLKTKFMPPAQTTIAGASSTSIGKEWPPLLIGQWAPLLYEWYSHTHLTLNGAVSFIGQNEYIACGENIKIDASVLGAGANLNAQIKEDRDGGKKVWLLAHVESVSHGFSVQENGARSFLTTVQFVRGVFQDDQGNLMMPNGDILDPSITAETYELRENPQVVETKTALDPSTPPKSWW